VQISTPQSARGAALPMRADGWKYPTTTVVAAPASTLPTYVQVAGAVPSSPLLVSRGIEDVMILATPVQSHRKVEPGSGLTSSTSTVAPVGSALRFWPGMDALGLTNSSNITVPPAGTPAQGTPRIWAYGASTSGVAAGTPQQAVRAVWAPSVGSVAGVKTASSPSPERRRSSEAPRSPSAMRSQTSRAYLEQLGMRLGMKPTQIRGVTKVLEDQGFYTRFSLQSLTLEMAHKMQMPQELATALLDDCEAGLQQSPRDGLPRRGGSPGHSPPCSPTKGRLQGQGQGGFPCAETPRRDGDAGFFDVFAGFPGRLRDYCPEGQRCPSKSAPRSPARSPSKSSPRSPSRSPSSLAAQRAFSTHVVRQDTGREWRQQDTSEQPGSPRSSCAVMSTQPRGCSLIGAASPKRCAEMTAEVAPTVPDPPPAQEFSKPFSPRASVGSGISRSSSVQASRKVSRAPSAQEVRKVSRAPSVQANRERLHGAPRAESASPLRRSSTRSERLSVASAAAARGGNASVKVAAKPAQRPLPGRIDHMGDAATKPQLAAKTSAADGVKERLGGSRAEPVPVASGRSVPVAADEPPRDDEVDAASADMQTPPLKCPPPTSGEGVTQQSLRVSIKPPGAKVAPGPLWAFGNVPSVVAGDFCEGSACAELAIGELQGARLCKQCLLQGLSSMGL